MKELTELNKKIKEDEEITPRSLLDNQNIKNQADSSKNSVKATLY